MPRPPGPWEHVDHGPPTGSFMGCGQVITMGADVFGGDIAGPTGDLYPRGGYSPLDDMALIALMGPPVALALAELLDGYAEWFDMPPFTGFKNANDERFVTLARAILREEES
jgi:hypothetical protein